MKKTTKILFLIITFFTFLSTSYAETSNLTIKDKLAELTLNSSDESFTMYYLFSEKDNNFLYTYSPYDSYEEGEYTKTYDFLSSKNVNYIAYFGYGYQDRTDITWYITTQYLIWQDSLSDSDILIFKDEDLAHTCEEQARIILEDIERMYIYPSFTTFFDDLDPNNKSYIKPHEGITFIDENNVLDEFEVIHNTIYSYEKTNSEITFNFNTAGTAYIYFYRKEETSNTTVIYHKDNNTVFSRGTTNLYRTSYVVVEATLPTVTINFSKDKFYYPSLEDIKYSLYNQNNDLIETFNANNMEKIIMEQITYGEYYLKETSNVSGYYPNEEIIPLEVLRKDTNEDIEINIFKEAYLKNVNFTKYLEDINGNISPDANSTFSLYTKDNELISTFKTNDEGFYLLTLPYGEYIIREETSPNGYLNEDIILKIDDNTKEDFTVTSPELLGTLNLTFKDNLSENLINGLTSFKVKKIAYKARNLSLNEETTYSIDNGMITLDELPYGDYIISDITIPDNYKIDEEEITFSIDESHSDVDLTIYSELKTGSILIKEIDKTTGEPISNTTFRVYNSNGELLWEEKTNSDGIIELLNVPIGEYYLKRVLSLESNIESDEEIILEVKEDTETIITFNNRTSIQVPITGSNINHYLCYELIFIEGLFFYYDTKKR